MMEHPSVGIFWDFENVHPPTGISGYEVVSKIWKFVEPFGPVSTFKAYLDVNIEASKAKQQHELQSSGVSIIHTPHNGKKEAADKILIVDIMLFALETSSLKTIVLITGDQGFHYATSMLRLKGHKIYIVHSHTKPPPILAHTTHGLFNWQADILKCTGAGLERYTVPLITDNVLAQPGSSTEVYPDDTLAKSTQPIKPEESTYLPVVSDNVATPERGDGHVSRMQTTLKEETCWEREANGWEHDGWEPKAKASDWEHEANSLRGCWEREANGWEPKASDWDHEANSNQVSESTPLPPPSQSTAIALNLSTKDNSTHEPALPPCSSSIVNHMANFEVLIKVLKQKGASTTKAIRIQGVYGALLDCDPLVFKRYGNSMQSFLNKAEEFGIVRLLPGSTKATKRFPHIILCPTPVVQFESAFLHQAADRDTVTDTEDAERVSRPETEINIAPRPTWGEWWALDDAHLNTPSESPEDVCVSQLYDTALAQWDDARSTVDFAHPPSGERAAPGVQRTPNTLAASRYIESLPNIPENLVVPDAISSNPFSFSAASPPFIPQASIDSQCLPDHFGVLVDVLIQMGASTARPLKLTPVGRAVKARLGGCNPLRNLGYNVDSYFEKAEELGLICLSSQLEKNETGKQKMRSVSYLTLAPGAKIQPTSSDEVTPLPQAGVSATLEDPAQGPSNTPTTKVDFKLLVDVLKKLGASHGSSSRKKPIVDALLCRDAGALSRLNVTQKQYFDMAVKTGIIQLTPDNKGKLKRIALCPKYY